MKCARLTVANVEGREPYTRVDAWAAMIDGLLYSGTSDGRLLRLDPER